MPRASIATLALLVVVFAGTASAQPPAASATPAPTLAPAEAQRVFTDLLQRFFDAYARKDIEGMAALWHTGGPARYRRNVVVV